MRSRSLVLGIAVVLTACGGTAVSATPDASPTTVSAASSAPATASASTAPNTTPAPSTPATQPASPSAATTYSALELGSAVRPTVEGLRVRAAPGATGELLATMPLDAYGLVELGPLPVDGYDWYRIRAGFFLDNLTDGGADHGWVAYGPSTSPWLVPDAGDRDPYAYNPYVAGGAGTGPGVVGPVEIDDQNYGVLWAAVGDACPLDIHLNDVAIASTSVDEFAEGNADSDLFVEHPELVRTSTFEVSSECSWAITVVRYQG